ncbi:glycosyl transferase family protein [Psychromonas sp. RZ22]|uniref:glycosyl transferase family protein n=1 Tax=Psychromonas algarum TaxID=2555643 RepID=UPI001067ED40|nr:glycosyl transferase family protein [Psychromonas sp. RZ22]TEW56108.1 glycosyl transferase family protein [Psychromonas sp. RZ22]
MFSEYIKLTGRGEKGRRPLTMSEAEQALTDYLNGDASLLQMAVLLMLQRVRCETPEEAAGYIKALRTKVSPEWKALTTDLDWPCFAGKKRQPPWLLLAAKVLAADGVKILLHGHMSVDLIKYQVESACPLLNISIADTPESAQAALQKDALVYIPLSSYCPELIELLALREQVGLRTPLNTVARSINPSAAPYSIHGVFHKSYEKIHAQAAVLNKEYSVIAFKGEGGESEVNPRVSTLACGVVQVDGKAQYVEQDWPTYLEDFSGSHTEVSAEYLLKVWNKEIVDEYGDAAVITTVAMVLKQMHPEHSQSDVLEKAKQLWETRKL